MAKLAASTYGEALFELAAENNAVDSFYEEVNGVIQVLEENPDLMKLVRHPKIVKEEKVAVIENIFKGRISDHLTGFLVLLVKKDRFGELMEIFDYFIGKIKEYKKIGVAYVTTVTDLKEAQKESVVSKLLQVTSFETLEMHYETDQSLIGGMVIRIGDRVVDSSIKTKLSELSKELYKVQLSLL